MADLIDRQAAKDAVNQIAPIDTEYDSTLYDKVDIMYVLDDLPPVHAEPCEDAISRQAVLDLTKAYNNSFADVFKTHNAGDYFISKVKALPPVHVVPKTGHCRDCKWWKDSDGVYRRGIKAESSCPFNTKEIYDGDACCYRFVKNT